MDDNIIGQLLLQIILIVFNAVFACAEIAVLSFNNAKLEKLSEEGNKRAIRLARLTCQPARFLATIQVAITLSGFLGSAFAAENFASLLTEWLIGLGVRIPVSTLNSISVVLITLILSYITLVFGELVPKRLAMKKAESLSLALSGLITFISKLFAPIVWLLTVSTNGLLRLLGIDPDAEDSEVSEESEMIQNVFEFDDLTVGEIVTHRTEIAFLWNDESIEEWDKTIKSTSYSFYPICEDSIDNIIGVLNAKIYLRLTDLSRENVMKEAVREVFFVPESMKADTLFRSMKKNRNNFAVVLDEYGGTHGIVTMSDLLVQIVGEFDDEDTEEDILPAGENAWRINCRAEIEKLERLFDIEIDTESATVGGWVVEQFEDIPNEGSTLVYDDSFSIEVTKTDNKRVQEVIVRAIEKPKETEEEKD